MSLLNVNICFGRRCIRFQQYFKTKIQFFVIFYIYIYIYIIGDICTCNVSINKIRNVGTSVIPLFRVILTEMSIYCITFMIQGHFQSQKVHFKARSSKRNMISTKKN